jgi:transposase
MIGLLLLFLLLFLLLLRTVAVRPLRGASNRKATGSAGGYLHKIDDTVPKDKQIHIICDNYATHKHVKVKRWLKLHKRFHVHFTPTSSSCSIG